jgi:hypothetical protein
MSALPRTRAIVGQDQLDVVGAIRKVAVAQQHLEGAQVSRSLARDLAGHLAELVGEALLELADRALDRIVGRLPDHHRAAERRRGRSARR